MGADLISGQRHARCGRDVFRDRDVFALLFSVFALYPEAPALGVGGLIAGIGGVLAVARGYWASSTKRVRERIGVVMDSIGQTLSQPETQVSGLKVGDGAAALESDASFVGDAELTGT